MRNPEVAMLLQANPCCILGTKSCKVSQVPGACSLRKLTGKRFCNLLRTARGRIIS